MKQFFAFFILTLITVLKLWRVTEISAELAVTRTATTSTCDPDASRQTKSNESTTTGRPFVDRPWRRRRRRRMRFVRDHEPDRNRDHGVGHHEMTTARKMPAEIRLQDDRPRTGVKNIKKIILTAVTMFFDQLELAVYLSLYKLKIIYTILIKPFVS